MSADAESIDRLIRRIPDYPKPGILFYDLTPVVADPTGLATCVDLLVAGAQLLKVDVVLGIEARGFMLGGALARALGVGLVLARKPGKLPSECVRAEYDLEYGTDAIELHRDAVAPGTRVLIHDDLLATGGTAEAAVRLVESLGATVAGISVVVELDGLGARDRLAGHDVQSIVTLPA